MASTDKKRLLFLFPHASASEIEKIEKGDIPSERLYGLFELRKRGWVADISDSRFMGFSGKILNWAKRQGLNYINLTTILEFRKYDVIVVKDDFSLVASLAAKLLKKKIVYFDSMFDIPKRKWKRWLIRLNIKLSDAIFAYSQSQIQLWSEFFRIPLSHFVLMKYTIDLGFYKPCVSEESAAPFVLAVGRDVGRDFQNLAHALENTGIGLKLVTLPYLVKEFGQKYPWVEIYERLSYPDLFRLYSQARLVVVPLKSGLTYPSGIRGVLESMALGKTTICTRTPVLEEFFEDEKQLVYVNAGDPVELRQKIQQLCSDDKMRKVIQQNAQYTVQKEFGMTNFVEAFEKGLYAVI